MKKAAIITFFFFIFTSFMSLNAQWARMYGGDSQDWANSVQQTNDGGYIVAGWTDSFGAGMLDFWILKLFSNGEIDWEKSYGGSGDDYAYSIQQTNDGGFIVTGTSTSPETFCDCWVLKLFSNGEPDWQRKYGGIYEDHAYSITQTNDGGYIIAGISYSFGGRAAWILKLSSEGNNEWQKIYPGIYSAYSIEQTNDGGYIAVGDTAGSFSVLKLFSDGEIDWQKKYDGGKSGDSAHSVQQTNDGGYIIAGTTNSFGDERGDFWIMKLFSDGEYEWQKVFGGEDNYYDRAYSVQQTNDGGYIATGYTSRNPSNILFEDLWALKLDSMGKIEWENIYDVSFKDRGYSIHQTKDGGFIVVGFTARWLEPSNLLALKLSADGYIDSSCGFIRGSNAQVLDTQIDPQVTNVNPIKTNVEPQDTYVISQKTFAESILICRFSLAFPVQGYGPYDVPVSAVLDHSVFNEKKVRFYKKNGMVEAFNGEIGNKDSKCYDKNCKVIGYKNEDSSIFLYGVLNYPPPDNDYLWYDGHSGYDFGIVNTIILATNKGKLYKADKDPVNGKGWKNFHTFYIDHENGYSSWYLHCENLAPEIEAEIAQKGYADVIKGQIVARSGKFGSDGYHLHFEVRQKGFDHQNIIDPYKKGLWE